MGRVCCIALTNKRSSQIFVVITIYLYSNVWFTCLVWTKAIVKLVINCWQLKQRMGEFPQSVTAPINTQPYRLAASTTVASRSTVLWKQSLIQRMYIHYFWGQHWDKSSLWLNLQWWDVILSSTQLMKRLTFLSLDPNPKTENKRNRGWSPGRVSGGNLLQTLPHFSKRRKRAISRRRPPPRWLPLLSRLIILTLTLPSFVRPHFSFQMVWKEKPFFAWLCLSDKSCSHFLKVRHCIVKLFSLYLLAAVEFLQKAGGRAWGLETQLSVVDGCFAQLCCCLLPFPRSTKLSFAEACL